MTEQNGGILTLYLHDFDIQMSFGVPVWFIVCDCIVVLLSVLYVLYQQYDKRWIPRILLFGYLLYILGTTILFRTTQACYRYDLGLVSKYARVFEERIPVSLYDILMNTLLFVPLGIMLGLSKFKRICNILKGCEFAFVLSFTIELFQLVTKRGKFELSDMIHNTLGCMIGYALVLMLQSMKNRISN